MNFDELLVNLKTIREAGFIKTHRPSDTGIGKTLEDLLGIKENNIALPDIGEVELKAKRLDSGSMLTLATKAPLPRGVNRTLFEAYKYKDDCGSYCLHSTVYASRPNAQSFKTNITNEALVLENNKNIRVYWPLSIFDEVLKTKSDKILLVFAATKGKRKDEQFHYKEAYLLSGLNQPKFINAILIDKLKVDIRIGFFRSGKYKGKYHDHGTGFRISKRDFLELYDEFKQII